MKPSGIVNESCIQVMLTGDGTRVSYSMHILVIAFTRGNENPNSPWEKHVIAMLNILKRNVNIYLKH